MCAIMPSLLLSGICIELVTYLLNEVISAFIPSRLLILASVGASAGIPNYFTITIAHKPGTNRLKRYWLTLTLDTLLIILL